jgi:hypothetical protein
MGGVAVGRDAVLVLGLSLKVGSVLALHLCAGRGPRVPPGARDPAILATRAEVAVIEELFPDLRDRSLAARSPGPRVVTPRIPGDTAAIAPDRWWRTR